MGITDAGYGIRTGRSREIFERLERSIPGGNTRSLAYFPPYPLLISSGSGCRIGVADGNEFIDLLNNYTASVHGHALPAINEAMSNQAALGTVFPAPSELQAELAERIVGRVASVEKVRFANSGTEAVMMAVRGARAFTVLITHDLTFVWALADRVAIMYLGKIVELGPAQTVLTEPLHPYTKSLLAVTPEVGRRRSHKVLTGEPPDPAHIPLACRFHPRCPVLRSGEAGSQEPRCLGEVPALEEPVPGHRAACHVAAAGGIRTS